MRTHRFWMLMVWACAGSLGGTDRVMAEEAAAAEVAPQAVAMPDWLSAHMRFMIEGTGVWETDNAAHVGEAEPFVRYQTCWRHGVGETSLAGALIGIRADDSTARLWEFRMFWDTVRKQAVISQWGGWNTYLSGPVTAYGDHGHESIQQQSNWDGSTGQTRHLTIEEGQTHRTTSFSVSEGQWKKDREYVWHRVSSGPCQV